jgi:hypothetical protein
MLFGTADFIDPADSIGYVGLGGDPTVETDQANAASVITVDGTISGFTFLHDRSGTDAVSYEVVHNGALTAIACTTLTQCTAAGPLAVSAGDTISIEVSFVGDEAIDDMRWSATLAASTP